MKKLVTTLWFADLNSLEAVEYYLTVFKDSRILQKVYYPKEELDEHFVGMKDKLLVLEFELNGQKFIGFDGGPYFRFNEAISITIECEGQAEIDYYWEKLSHVPEAEACGWCKDRFGLSWQVVPDNMNDLMISDAQIQCLMQMKKIDIATLESLA